MKRALVKATLVRASRFGVRASATAALVTAALATAALVTVTLPACGTRDEAPVHEPRNERSPFGAPRTEALDLAPRATPRPWTELREIAIGELFMCGLARGGVYCWGTGRFGELGLGGSDQQQREAVPAGPLRGIGDAIAIDANRGFACAINSGGAVFCWGNNVHGQLGDGTTQNRAVPVPVEGLPLAATAVTAGYQHTCAVLADRRVACWGENADGQLGFDGGGMHLRPTIVRDLTQVDLVAAGRATTCALRSGGAVLCWGSNQYGELGRGVGPDELASSPLPRPVTGIERAVHVDGYGDHFCAVGESGAVWCWGGQTAPTARELRARDRRIAANLPVDPLPRIGAPWRVDGIDEVVEVAVGMGFSCARRLSGHVYCWGDNTWAQLGTGAQASRDDPSPMAGIVDATALFAGARNTCVRRPDGVALCSGSNRGGEIGNAGSSTALTPAPVMAPQ